MWEKREDHMIIRQYSPIGSILIQEKAVFPLAFREAAVNLGGHVIG